MERDISVLVLGAAGYVGGELLRLIAVHPHLRLSAATSRSQAERPLSDQFPHLGPFGMTRRFADPSAIESVLHEGEGPLAVFGCAGHGESAVILANVLSLAEHANRAVHLVDLSADFRLPSAALYEEVYGQAHGAPQLIERFFCGLPDISRQTPSGPIAEPGCFTTAVTLAATPLIARGIAKPRVIADAVTGSTGSGILPSATTHHPERHASMRAYKPLAHRHRPEMELLVGRASDRKVEVLFVPHSGPFARGIHATVHLELETAASAEDLVAIFREFYAESPFVDVVMTPPSLKHVVGTNRARLSVAALGHHAVVTSVIDNLTKGAAGGALQWMNRLLGLNETAGLDLPAVPWS